MWNKICRDEMIERRKKQKCSRQVIRTNPKKKKRKTQKKDARPNRRNPTQTKKKKT